MDKGIAEGKCRLRQRRGENAVRVGFGLPFGVEDVGATNDGGVFGDGTVDNRSCGGAGVCWGNPFMIDASADGDCVAGLRALAGVVDGAERVIGGTVGGVRGAGIGLLDEPFAGVSGCGE